MIFKVCGMRDPENIRRIDLSGADWMGFVFYPPSPRRVESLPAFMPEYARRVGVFVDEPVENIQVRAKEFGLDYLQLHGSESPDDCLRLQDRGRPRSTCRSAPGRAVPRTGRTTAKGRRRPRVISDKFASSATRSRIGAHRR